MRYAFNHIVNKKIASVIKYINAQNTSFRIEVLALSN